MLKSNNKPASEIIGAAFNLYIKSMRLPMMEGARRPLKAVVNKGFHVTFFTVVGIIMVAELITFGIVLLVLGIVNAIYDQMYSIEFLLAGFLLFLLGGISSFKIKHGISSLINKSDALSEVADISESFLGPLADQMKKERDIFINQFTNENQR